MGYYPFDTIENVAIAAFDDGAPVPVKQLELAITPVQTGTGDPAPDNVRPIIGFTKAEIAMNGVNQWDEEWEVGGINTETGEETAVTDSIRSKNYSLCVGGKSYYIKTPVAAGTYVVWYDISKTFISAALRRNQVAIAPANAAFFRLSVQGVYGTVYKYDISVNYPHTETDYHKFNGEVYNVEFPAAAGTVYGGTLKYTGGKYLLTVDKGYKDLGSLNWEVGASQSVFFVLGVNSWLPLPDMQSEAVNAICEKYKTTSYNEGGSTDETIYTSWKTAGVKALYVHDTAYTEVVDFKASLNGVKIVYELITPQTYEITAEVVETLYRNNVIFANTGNIITLEYRLNQFDYYRRLNMQNFGYIMMDGGGIDLSSSDPQTINGAWDRTVTAIKTGKPIFAFNTKYGSGKNLTPVPVFAWYINSTTAVIVGATLHIQVSSDDTCVVQDVAPSANRAAILAIDALAEQAVDPEEFKSTKATKAKK